MTLELLSAIAMIGEQTKARTGRALVFLTLLMSAPAIWGGNVLIMNGVPGSGFGGADETRLKITNDLQTVLTDAGHTVTVLNSIPEGLSAYDQIWDIDFAHAIPDAPLKQYADYLRDSTKRLFVIGENGAFVARNTSVIGLIAAATGVTHTFAIPPKDLPGTEDNKYTQTVLPPFTGPNAIGGNTVTYLAPGGVTSAGKGQFITVHSESGIGTAIAFNNLIVVFDTSILTRDVDVPDMQHLLYNFIGFVPPPPAATIGSVLANVGRPFGVAVHEGYAYIADPSTHTVWKVNVTNPADKTPVAGVGWDPNIDPQDRQGYNGDGIDALHAQLDNPSGVAVDANGNIYIADTGNHAIRRIGVGSSFITTVAGIPTSFAVGENTDPACQAEGADLSTCASATGLRLFGPRAVASDASGNIYIADRMNQQVKKLYTSGPLNGMIFVVAGLAGYPGGGDGPVTGLLVCPPGTEFCTTAARLNSPVGVAVDSENNAVYVADEGNNRIAKVAAGNVSTVLAGSLLRPTGVAVSSGGGNLYIADYGNHRIQRATGCSTDGCGVTTIVGTGTPGLSGGAGTAGTSVQLNSPIAVSLNGTVLYIADMLNGRILSGDFTPPVILLK